MDVEFLAVFKSDSHCNHASLDIVFDLSLSWQWLWTAWQADIVAWFRLAWSSILKTEAIFLRNVGWPTQCYISQKIVLFKIRAVWRVYYGLIWESFQAFTLSDCASIRFQIWTQDLLCRKVECYVLENDVRCHRTDVSATNFVLLSLLFNDAVRGWRYVAVLLSNHTFKWLEKPRQPILASALC
jgi:hypothetical protein